MTRRTEDGECHERKYQRVEAGDDRRPGDTGVAEHLRNVDRCDAGAREYVAQHTAADQRRYAAENLYRHALSVAAGGVSPSRRTEFHYTAGMKIPKPA